MLHAMTLPTIFMLAALGTLAACGGGSNGQATPPAAPAPSPGPSPGPAPPPATAGTRATCNLANFAGELLTLVNQHRAAGASCGARGSFPAVPALVWNDALTRASLVHSDDMVALNFFSHTGSNGSSAGDRATAAGYP
jgi:uncharacterized protein YkwD